MSTIEALSKILLCLKDDAATSDSPKKFIVKKMNTEWPKKAPTAMSRSGVSRYQAIHKEKMNMKTKDGEM